MKKTKMFFPANVNTGKTGYIAGEFNDVLETPGSVQRWLNRGCTIVEENIEEPKKEIEEPKKEIVEEIEEKVENEVVEEVVEPKKAKPKKKAKKTK